METQIKQVQNARRLQVDIETPKLTWKTIDTQSLSNYDKMVELLEGVDVSSVSQSSSNIYY